MSRLLHALPNTEAVMGRPTKSLSHQKQHAKCKLYVESTGQLLVHRGRQPHLSTSTNPYSLAMMAAITAVPCTLQLPSSPLPHNIISTQMFGRCVCRKALSS